MDSKDKIYARLQKSKNLPSLPQVLLKLIETCDKDDMALSDISAILIKDASMSSRVLTLVNSAYFSLNNTFASIDQAVVYLGADTIKNIAVTASVQQVFRKLGKNESFSMDRFWWDSFSSAVFAKRIARQSGYSNVEEAYLAGLLHDLGELLLLMNFTDEYTALQNKGYSNANQCMAEDSQIGINHCEAGAWLAKQWKLNCFIADTILYHHATLEEIKGASPLVKVVYLAEQYHQVSEGDFDAVYHIGGELFDFGTKQIDEIYKGVEEEIHEVAQSLGVKVDSSSESIAKPTLEPTEHDLELLHQVKNYSLLHGLLENLLEAEDKDATLKSLERALNVLFDIETIFFFLYDFEQQKFYGSASTLNPETERLQGVVLSAEQGTSLLVKSMLEKQLIVSTQDTEFPLGSLADSQLLSAVGGKGMLYLPMTAQRKSVGVIVIRLPDSQEKDLFSEEDCKILQMLANQAGISLYLDEVQRKHAEKIEAARLEASSMAAAKVVHEVNNPLGIIKNYLKILEIKVPEKDSLKNEFAILDEEITRIATIIQQSDTFSTGGKQHFELIDVNSLLSSLLAILSKSVFYSSRLQVHFSPDPDLPNILTDGDAIKQIVINLIKNAAEAMADGGNVYIETRSGSRGELTTVYPSLETGDCIEITIRDDGPGLSDSVLSKPFEPFASTKGKGHSGLGLTIINSLVTELKGMVTCTSNKETGTLFTISLPMLQHSAG